MTLDKCFQKFSLTLPIMFAYIPLGGLFGLLMVNQGIEWYWPPLFSLIIFAGAMQFALVGLLAAGASFGDIAILTVLINFRHLFYGFSLLHLFPGAWLKRLYFILCITDENYSLLTSQKFKTNANQFSPSVLMAINHGYWVLGALIGAVFTQNAELYPTGVEFCLTALFTVLALEQIKANQNKQVYGLIMIAAIIALWWFKTYFLLAAALLFILVLGGCNLKLLKPVSSTVEDSHER